MSMREVWICDSCGAEERTDEGDGPPMTWDINIDNEDFCEKCAKLLDPYKPELDEEWGPDSAQQILERGPR